MFLFWAQLRKQITIKALKIFILSAFSFSAKNFKLYKVGVEFR